MTSQKPLPIHLHIHQAGTWRAYALPFAHIRQFSNFSQIADELLTECIPSESTPTPGGWDVLDDSGSILKRRFWEDLAVPGGKYYLAPGAGVTASGHAAPQKQEVVEEPPGYSEPTTRGYPDVASRNYEPATRNYEPAARTYNEPAARTYNEPTARPYNEPIARPYTEPPLRDDAALFNPPTPPKSWAQVAQVTQVAPVVDEPTPEPWTHVAKRVTGTVIKITVRDSDCKVILVLNLPRNATIGQLVERLGGKPGSKVQLLNRVPGGFTPGATYMIGTRKTMAEAGWGNSVQLCFLQGAGEEGKRRVDVGQGRGVFGGGGGKVA